MSDGTIVCRRCGAVNDPGANYCYQCGAFLAGRETAGAEPPAAAETPPTPSPEPAPPAPETGSAIEPGQAVAPAAEAPPAEAPVESETEPEAAPSPSSREPAGGAAPPPEWPFVVSAGQEESSHGTGTPPPPPAPGWTGQASGPPPLAENVTSSARYIVLAGIGLLVLSCLWVFLSIGTHLQARFGIFCLAPLGLVFLVVGLFLMLSRGPNRRT